MRISGLPSRSLLALACLAVFSLPLSASTYYVDASAGTDAADGASPERAWRSFQPANSRTFAPGDSLLLRAGGRWVGQALHPLGSGSPGKPLRIGRYGDGPSPALQGEGKVPAVLVLDNQEFWEISGLDISNRAQGPSPLLRGIMIRAADAGWMHHIVLRDLSVHDVTGPSADYKDEDNSRKSYGGIFFSIEGTAKPTAWDDVLVERCALRDLNAVGLVFASSWAHGHRANNPATWKPSTHVVIRGNTFERSARNGLIVRACVNPLVERNLFSSCALSGSGNACFAFDCDGALFQYNEACGTRFNPGDVDAAGFDSDWNCRGTVFQYNYSHDNDYGFILLCCKGKGFNDGTIVRYNVSEGDGGVIVRVSGTVTHSLIANNTFYARRDMRNPRTPGASPKIVYFKSWDGWAEDTAFINNLVFNDCLAAEYDMGKSRGTRFDHNLFFGNHPANEPVDAHKVTGDPLLRHPGAAGPGWASVPGAYAVAAGSAAIGAGIDPAFGGTWLDYAGRPASPKGGRVDIGAFSAP